MTENGLSYRIFSSIYLNFHRKETGPWNSVLYYGDVCFVAFMKISLLSVIFIEIPNSLQIVYGNIYTHTLTSLSLSHPHTHPTPQYTHLHTLIEQIHLKLYYRTYHLKITTLLRKVNTHWIFLYSAYFQVIIILVN